MKRFVNSGSEVAPALADWHQLLLSSFNQWSIPQLFDHLLGRDIQSHYQVYKAAFIAGLVSGVALSVLSCQHCCCSSLNHHKFFLPFYRVEAFGIADFAEL